MMQTATEYVELIEPTVQLVGTRTHVTLDMHTTRSLYRLADTRLLAASIELERLVLAGRRPE